MFPLQIVAEEVSGTNDYVQLTFRAHKLDNKVRAPEHNPPLPCSGVSPLLITHRSQGPDMLPPSLRHPLFCTPGSIQQI